ncbi:MAG: peptide chain release factor N(5)-glutamine methyltransferase [Xanthomonadales bacterium]|nr:peptide chain release factor N(5)-glutamine methyltransferase [Xanthomonadales bacterium]
MATLEAEILLAHALGTRRTHLFAHPEASVEKRESRHYRELLSRRNQGEPIAYLTGEKEFWSLALRVSPDVLIPRPETEILVEAALKRIPADGRQRIVDLGTGSGAVALAIAHERPLCEVHATDSSKKALRVARENATRLGLDRVQFHLGSWFEPLGSRFDAVLSNPPYVPDDDPHLAQGDVRFEPRAALLGGRDGLDSIRVIAAAATRRLNPAGWLILEHGHDQGEECAKILSQHGFSAIETHLDLSGNDRVTLGTLS